MTEKRFFGSRCSSVIANGEIADMTAVALFVAAAMNPESDGWDQDDGLSEDEFMYEESVFQLGSPEHALLAAVATGANSWFLRAGLGSA